MLASKDFTAASAFLQRLYGQRDAGAFPAFLVRELHRLIGAENVTWNTIALADGWAEVVSYPKSNPDHVTASFAAHMHEHPGIQEWLRHGVTGTRAISDFLSHRAYRRSTIYQHVYRELGYEEQFATALTPPTGQALALAYGRASRDVSPRDREVAELVAPHVLVAYRNVQALHRAERALAGHREVAAALGHCVIDLDARLQPADLPRRARDWLRDYFGDDGCLPAAVQGWLQRALRGPSGAPLVRRRGERRLVLRAFPLAGGGALLALEERGNARAGAHLRAAGLTRREIEVLSEVEAGRTNREIAATLSLATGTVKKHLDNIYAKLGVTNRTAAVARLRGGGR